MEFSTDHGPVIGTNIRQIIQLTDIVVAKSAKFVSPLMSLPDVSNAKCYRWLSHDEPVSGRFHSMCPLLSS